MVRETPDPSGRFRGHKKNEGRQCDFYQVSCRFYSGTEFPSNIGFIGQLKTIKIECPSNIGFY